VPDTPYSYPPTSQVPADQQIQAAEKLQFNRDTHAAAQQANKDQWNRDVQASASSTTNTTE
jgi:hypothetical protein